MARQAGKKGRDNRARLQGGGYNCESVCVHMWTECERGTPQCVSVHVRD